MKDRHLDLLISSETQQFQELKIGIESTSADSTIERQTYYSPRILQFQQQNIGIPV